MRSKKLQRDLKIIQKEREKVINSPHYKMLLMHCVDERESNSLLENRIEKKNTYIRKLQTKLDIAIFLLTFISIIAILG